MYTSRTHKRNEVNEEIIQVGDCYVDFSRTPIKSTEINSLSPVLCLKKLDLNPDEFCNYTKLTAGNFEVKKSPLLDFLQTPVSMTNSQDVENYSDPSSPFEKNYLSVDKDSFATKSFYKGAPTKVDCYMKYKMRPKISSKEQVPRAKRALIKQSPKHSKPCVTTKARRAPSCKANGKRKKNPVAFMKKFLLEKPEKTCNSQAELVSPSVKHKFFTNSSRDKKPYLTTTIFGNHRMSFTLSENKNISKPSKESQCHQINSSVSICLDDKLGGTCNNLQSSSATATSSVSYTDDFLSLTGSESIEKPNDVFPEESFSDVGKENGTECLSPLSDRKSLSTKKKLGRIHMKNSSVTQMCIQQYCYNGEQSESNRLIDENTMQKDFNLFDSSDSEETDGAEILRLDSDDSLPGTTESTEPKAMKKPWPIHYSTQKEQDYKNLKLTAKTQSPKPSFSKNRVTSRNTKEQLIIDAGQKNIGAQLCGECGMLYCSSSNEDTALHFKVHNNVIVSLRFMGWKRERVIREYHDGKVILILPEDPKFALKKADEVKQVMDTDLGFHSITQPDQLMKQTFLFIMKKKVVGCLIAEAIKQGFRIIPSQEGPPSCSTIAEPAVCGINRIWTLATHRRQQIATRLVDCMKTAFYYGCEISVNQIAFSDPTPNGRLFAMNYTNTEDFLVYK